MDIWFMFEHTKQTLTEKKKKTKSLGNSVESAVSRLRRKLIDVRLLQLRETRERMLVDEAPVRFVSVLTQKKVCVRQTNCTKCSRFAIAFWPY